MLFLLALMTRKTINMLVNKLKNYWLPTALFGFGTSILVTLVVLSRDGSGVFSTAVYTIIGLAIIAILNYLLGYKLRWSGLVSFLLGYCAWMIWIFPELKISLFVELYILPLLLAATTFTIATIIRITPAVISFLKGFGKHEGKIYGWKKIEKKTTYYQDPLRPLQGHDHIQELRDNVGDQDLFSSIDNILQKLHNSILSTPSHISNVIFINGPWGSGKSTVIQLLKEKLSETNKKSKLQKPIWVEASPLQYSNNDELISELYNDIKHSAYKELGIDLDPEISVITSALTEAFDGILTKIPGLSYIIQKFLRWQSIAEARNKINSKLDGVAGRIIVAIDDLDRVLDVKDILLIFKVINHFRDIPSVDIVVALDYKKVNQTIASVRANSDPNFLQKFYRKMFTLPQYEYRELEGIYISYLVENGKLAKAEVSPNRAKAEALFEDYFWEANKRLFSLNLGNNATVEVGSQLYQRYEDIYRTFLPGGDYANDFRQHIKPVLEDSIKNIIEGNMNSTQQLVRRIIRPIQKIERGRLWQNHSANLIDAFKGLGISETNPNLTSIGQLLTERDDIYGQALVDQVADKFTSIKQEHQPRLVQDESNKTFESASKVFTNQVSSYVKKYEDLKGDDYDYMLTWLSQQITPRNAVMFAAEVEEEIVDWDNEITKTLLVKRVVMEQFL